MQKEDPSWYASWFNSPYYHILYKERDYSEAADFMLRLTQFLKLRPNAKILDLACGKGRHSKHLATLGYSVTGVDLAKESIKYAKQFEKNNLSFKVHDMRTPFNETFNAVFNLFTSFGYFESEIDNLKTIDAIKKELKPNGLAVIDFLNANYVKSNLVPSEEKVIDGITFNITRKVENQFIIKQIEFKQNSENYLFTEKVKALTLENFEFYFKEAGLKLKHTFGDYHLNTFDVNNSERLILIFGT